MPDDRSPLPDPLDKPGDFVGHGRRSIDPAEARIDDLLRAAFRADEGAVAADAGGPLVPAPDPGRVAGHFAGVGDGDLLDAASDHDSVRRLLVEIAEIEAELRNPGGEAPPRLASGPPSSARVSGAVRARAIAAFGAGRRAEDGVVGSDHRMRLAEASGGVAVRGAGPASDFAVPSARRPKAGHWTRLAIAASILAVPGVGLLVGGHRADAAVLALASFDRVDATGAVETSGTRRLIRGDVVVARPGERVALRLSGGARIVLGEQSRMSLGCDVPCDGRCGGPVFDVEAGDVAVAASASTGVAEPVALRVPSAGRVDVFEGAARVERDAAGAASLLLRADARVRWSPEAGVARELLGPATLALGTEASSGQGSVVTGIGAVLPPPSATAFRDLEFFDGSVRRADDSIRVGSRRWRIRPDDGHAPLGSTAAVASADGARVDLPGAASIRFALAVGATGRVSWAADAPIFASRRLEVRCRVTGDAGSSVVVRLEGVEGPAAVVPVRARALPSGRDHDQAEPERVVFELPASFEGSSDALRELVLSFAARDGSATVWFEGAAFFGASNGARHGGDAGGTAADDVRRDPPGGN